MSHNNQIQILRESKLLFSKSFNDILILFALFDLLEIFLLTSFCRFSISQHKAEVKTSPIRTIK